MMDSKRKILIACLFVLSTACAFFSMPWSMPRPTVLDKPLTPTSSLEFTPLPTRASSCSMDWSVFPTAAAEPLVEIPAPAAPFELPDEIRILGLLGSDQVSPFVGRTDAVLLLLYHPRLARASLVSLPPDMLTYVPGFTLQRLNTAFAVGGSQTFAHTIQYNLGLCMDNYALIHLDDFTSFVDDLGGIYVDVLDGHPKACGGMRPGRIQMDGEKLLCYLSYRIGDAELERNLRQQEVFRLLFQRVVRGGSLVHLPDWIETYYPLLETDLTSAELLDAIPLALRLGDIDRLGFFRFAPADLAAFQIPGEMETSVFLPDLEGFRVVLNDAIEFIQRAEPPSELVLTLQYELTTSPTATITPTPTNTGTATVTPTRTFTPVRIPTRTRTPTLARTPAVERTATFTPTPPPRIAFSADQNGDGFTDVLTMQTSGSDVRVVSQTGQNVLVWDWRPDGGALVFEQAGQLHLASADGSTSLVLQGQPAGTNSQAAWSPNGAWIVFRNDNLVSDLFMIRSDGSNLTRLTDDAATDAFPDWLPDGSRVVFVSDRDGTPDLYAMELGGLVASPPVPVPVPSIPVGRLTSTTAQEASPHYSPNGAQIVFARLDADWNIYVGIATDLFNPTLLTSPGTTENMPSWSPDGAAIVFVREGQIFRMGANGAGQTEIVNGLAGESNPVWEP